MMNKEFNLELSKRIISKFLQDANNCDMEDINEFRTALNHFLFLLEEQNIITEKISDYISENTSLPFSLYNPVLEMYIVSFEYKNKILGKMDNDIDELIDD